MNMHYFKIKIKEKIIPMLKSPAVVSALLINGIILGFIVVNYLHVSWSGVYTIIFYGVISTWAMALIWRPILRWRLSLIDIFFGVFLIAVFASTVINFWSGTVKYILYMPIFMLLPYFLGRLMGGSELMKFQMLLMYLGGLIIILTPYEYVNMVLPYPNWPVPVVFGQSHGIMLAGLILCPMLMVIIARILFSSDELNNWSCFHWYILTLVVVVVVGWMQARGSILATLVAAPILFVVSPAFNRMKKISIILTLSVGVLCVIVNPFQNKYSKITYSQILDSPPVFLGMASYQNNLNDAGGGVDNAQIRILGELACQIPKNSITDRYLHYQTAIAIFLKYPYWGAGANKYGHFSCSGPGWYPHSTILQVLAELGFFVFLVYMIMLFLATRALLGKLYRSKNLAGKSTYSFLIAYFIFQFVTNQIYGNYYMSAGFYFVIGVAARIFVNDSQLIKEGN